MVGIIEDRHQKMRLRESRIDGAMAIMVSLFSLLLITGRLFLFTPYEVSGVSMSPTLADGDRVMVTKEEQVEFGDIVVFTSPVNYEEDYIKRVIGVSGDTIDIKEGTVYVNGEQLQDGEGFGTTDTLREMEEVSTVVPEGHIFVLGDNRENSMDSRIFGAVPNKLLKGKLMCRILPIQDIGCSL